MLVYAVRIHHPTDFKNIRSTFRTLDLIGMALIISALTLLIVALNLAGESYSWSSPVIIGLFVGTGCAFIAFIIAENFATNPVVPMGLFVSLSSRNVPIMTGMGFVISLMGITDFVVPVSGPHAAILSPLCYRRMMFSLIYNVSQMFF